MADFMVLPRGEQERLQFIRWVLFLINAAEAAGLEGLNRHRLHALLFMSFASSRYYDIEPLRQRAQRTSAGPYYRAAHVALGMLTLSGLVEVKEFRAHPSAKDLQFDGEFFATREGLAVSAKLRETNRGAALYRFLLDLCLGASTTLDAEEEQSEQDKKSELDKVLVRDLTYQQVIRRPGNSLAIEETPGEKTPTFRGLRSIDDYLRERMTVNNRDVLSAYQKLLQRRAS